MRPAPATVSLVGAGPGDPGLITRWGAECLARADLVLYDYLANPALLAHAPETAERVCLGHHRTGRSLSQEEVNARMVEAARAGRTVVRLKGGDPSVFARTADELAALRAAGVPYRIVPGITAGLVARTTDDSAVALVTGHERAGKGGPPLDYGALADFPGTVILYMGVTSAPAWSSALIDRGVSPDTHVTVVRHCTRPEQETFDVALSEVGAVVSRGDIRPPSVFIVKPRDGSPSRHRPAATAGLLLAAHGSRNDRTTLEARTLATIVAERLAPVPVELGFVQFSSPTLADGLARLVRRGVRQATVVPLFLSRGMHVTRDIPAIVKEAVQSSPGLAIDVAQHVGAWPELAELAAERIRRALSACGADPRQTALLLVAHGSRRKAALEETGRLTQSLAAQTGAACSLTVFAAKGQPGMDRVLQAIEPLPARWLAVYPHFLFPGSMVGAVRQMTETWHRARPDRRWCLVEPSGSTAELAAAMAAGIVSRSHSFFPPGVSRPVP